MTFRNRPKSRSKGMWSRTYAPLEDRSYELNDLCTLQMMAMVGLLEARVDGAKNAKKW